MITAKDGTEVKSGSQFVKFTCGKCGRMSHSADVVEYVQVLYLDLGWHFDPVEDFGLCGPCNPNFDHTTFDAQIKQWAIDHRPHAPEQRDILIRMAKAGGKTNRNTVNHGGNLDVLKKLGLVDNVGDGVGWFLTVEYPTGDLPPSSG